MANSQLTWRRKGRERKRQGRESAEDEEKMISDALIRYEGARLQYKPGHHAADFGVKVLVGNKIHGTGGFEQAPARWRAIKRWPKNAFQRGGFLKVRKP